MRGHRGKPVPPAPRGAAAGTPPTKGILELDRFSEESLERWSELSAAGSLTSVGGRFNAGAEIDSRTFDPWPSLYLASDHATAYREKFQIDAGQAVDGLSPEELALSPGNSHTTVVLHGKLSRVFQLTPETLGPVARVLGKIKMPERAERIKKKLKFKPDDLRMLTTGKQLHDAVALHNWRVLPIQFGLPSASQILAELIRAADFEAVLYQSSKSGKKCLAVFVDRLAPGSCVALSGDPPAGVISRLDETTAEALAGWTQLGIRPPQTPPPPPPSP